MLRKGVTVVQSSFFGTITLEMGKACENRLPSDDLHEKHRPREAALLRGVNGQRGRTSTTRAQHADTGTAARAIFVFMLVRGLIRPRLSVFRSLYYYQVSKGWKGVTQKNMTEKKNTSALKKTKHTNTGDHS